MERCDFSSVIKIVHYIIGEKNNCYHPNLSSKLFATFANYNENQSFCSDEVAVCYFKNSHINLYKLDNFLIWIIIVFLCIKLSHFLTKQKMNHMDSFDEIAIYVVNNR